MTAKKKVTFEDELNLTPLEKEVITLKAVLDMINDMVNWAIMSFSFNDPNSSVTLNTRTHKAFFNILLVDFLSPPDEFFNRGNNYIGRLGEICKEPLMGELTAKQDNRFLKDAVDVFATWLSQTVVVERRWFPSINLEVDLRIRRQAFITMCGNISKHNFTQQTRQATKLLNILKASGQSFSREQCLIALEDFQAQFSDDIFIYHASTIAEFLNNIRWGIFFYASAERARCVTDRYDEKTNMNRYEYNYPTAVASDLGKNYYRGLMNDVGRQPYIQLFEVSKYLKTRY